MPECLYCGAESTHRVLRTPASRVSKRDNSMDPRGFYYFVFCEDCAWMPKREFSALWRTYPDRLYRHDESFDTREEAIRNMFSVAQPPG